MNDFRQRIEELIADTESYFDEVKSSLNDLEHSENLLGDELWDKGYLEGKKIILKFLLIDLKSIKEFLIDGGANTK